MNKKGFTLAELLVVLAVLILTLAGGVVVLPALRRQSLWRRSTVRQVWEKRVAPTPTPTPQEGVTTTPTTPDKISPSVTPTPSPAPQVGFCEGLSQGECETNWECDPIYRTGSCAPTGPIVVPVEVYCGCKSLTAQEKQNRLRDKDLCQRTNGQWGTRNCLCLPQKDGVPLHTPEEGTHHFVSQRGCVSEKTFCLETNGQWTPGQPCQPGSVGCTGYGKTNPICTCPAGKNFRSGMGCL